MVRFARWLPFALVLSSCGNPAERPVQLGMTVNVPQITLDRLDPQLHLRVFAKGDYTCNSQTGQVLQGGVHVANYAGGNVRPDVRCDATMWNPMRATVGEASPVDVCFASSAPAMVDVPAGDYIVLVEGSGASSSGTMRRIILGSGCAEISPTSGATQTVQIDMREQSDAAGVCGDNDVAGNEACDTGSETPACDHCHFPEVPVSTSAVMNPRAPSIGWTVGQRMVVGFEANASDDPFVHQLDQNGLPITNPAAFANDNILETPSPNEQHNVRVFATSSGYAATWESTARALDFDVKGTFSGYDAPPPSPPSVLVNRTSMTAMQDRRHPAVAVNGTHEVFVFEDLGSTGIRVASTTAAMPVTAPASDDALVAAGGMGATMAQTPQIAATTDGFVVVWAARTSDFDIFAIRLDAAGAPQGSPVRVNTETSGNQDQPTIAASGNDVVIAWRDASGADAADNQGTTVRWRHFDGSLAPDGNDRIAPTNVAGDQSAPTAAIAVNGVVLLAWEDASGSIRGREFRTNGSPVLNRQDGTDADFEVNAGAGNTVIGTGPRRAPSAAYGGAGIFGIVWLDQGLSQIRSRTIRAD